MKKNEECVIYGVDDLQNEFNMFEKEISTQNERSVRGSTLRVADVFATTFNDDNLPKKYIYKVFSDKDFIIIFSNKKVSHYQMWKEFVAHID